MTVDGRPVPLSALPFRLLEELVTCEGQVLTRSDLKQRLWPYAARIDTERRLNTAVRALREALGDTAETPKYVATIRGHGYRWIADQGASGDVIRPRKGWTGGAVVLGLTAFAFFQFGGSAKTEQVQVSSPRAGELVRRAEVQLAERYDWSAAANLYGRALEADPADLAAHRGLAWYHVNRGDPSKAWPHITKLLAAGHFDSSSQADTGWLLIRARQPATALGLCSANTTTHFNLLSCRHTALASLGDLAGARDVAVNLMKTAGARSSDLRSVRDAQPSVGYDRFLRWRVDHFARQGADWFQRAQLQAEAGQLEHALNSLEFAARAGDPLLIKLGSTEAFDRLRDHPRFQKLAVRVLPAKAALRPA